MIRSLTLSISFSKQIFTSSDTEGYIDLLGLSNLDPGDYEFSLDNEFGPFQGDTTFSNVSAGIHTIFVRDKRGCGTTSVEVSVIGYPKFFTPNNDGYNDYWFSLFLQDGRVVKGHFTLKR